MKHLKSFNESQIDVIFVRTSKFDNTGTTNKLPYNGIQCFAIYQNDLDKYRKELELWGGDSNDIQIVDNDNLVPYALDYNKCHQYVMGESKELPKPEPFNPDRHTMKFHRREGKSMLDWISDLGLGKECYQVILT